MPKLRALNAANLAALCVDFAPMKEYLIIALSIYIQHNFVDVYMYFASASAHARENKFRGQTEPLLWALSLRGTALLKLSTRAACATLYVYFHILVFGHGPLCHIINTAAHTDRDIILSRMGALGVRETACDVTVSRHLTDIFHRRGAVRKSSTLRMVYLF
jgi:hypothetical protein